ncbi:DUF3159 domain-containing protein [Cellulomonas sp. PhB143]|uniref:DUF3159 domain-containing protein n=1 Tax=Cellulomonas sp. PhB143 TaxID=2485186 RepID=UPI000FC2FD5D|nr:DUF3159 domain-containing protein [Cellulomonas sp. PhB143]ROS72980.1 uncharacterized protein DUF3159 [Cellulomonas sp. PhB143]
MSEPEGAPEGRGVRVLASDSFSVTDAVGGVRGLVESAAPGLVFVVVFVATGQSLTPALVSSAAVALVAVVARLVQRTPVTQALGGLLGVGIGIVWAWRSGAAQNYYAWGLWTNAAYLVALVVSVLVRWPAVGVVVEALRGGLGSGPGRATTAADAGRPRVPAGWSAWRSDAGLVRRYTSATWVMVAMFALRLAVQVPLFYSAQVGWLGTARLVMGLPLFALSLWIVWLLVRPRPAATEPDPR